MLGGVEHDPLVDLVGHRDDVPPLAELRQQRQLIPGEDFAGWVMRRVEQEHPGARPKRGGCFLRIE